MAIIVVVVVVVIIIKPYVWMGGYMGLQEVGHEDMDWIHLAQDRVQWEGVVNTVTKLRVL